MESMDNDRLEGDTVKVALLAPVPEAHLISGKECCVQHGRVAFGSDDFQLFRELEAWLNKPPKRASCQVLIYASHSSAPPSGVPRVTWTASYERSEERQVGTPPTDMFRPLTTKGEKWAVYWEVADLRALAKDEWLPIHLLQGKGSGKKYAKSFRPEGPLIVDAL